MKKAEHQGVYETITQYIDGVGDSITFAEKIDLCEQFLLYSTDDYAAEDFEGSPPANMLNFREQLMDTLEGMEKAEAYMAYAEFLYENSLVHAQVLDRIIHKIRASLDENGQEAVYA